MPERILPSLALRAHLISLPSIETWNFETRGPTIKAARSSLLGNQPTGAHGFEPIAVIKERRHPWVSSVVPLGEVAACSRRLTLAMKQWVRIPARAIPLLFVWMERMQQYCVFDWRTTLLLELAVWCCFNNKKDGGVRAVALRSRVRWHDGRANVSYHRQSFIHNLAPALFIHLPTTSIPCSINSLYCFHCFASHRQWLNLNTSVKRSISRNIPWTKQLIILDETNAKRSILARKIPKINLPIRKCHMRSQNLWGSVWRWVGQKFILILNWMDSLVIHIFPMF